MSNHGRFATTRWSLIDAARGADTAARRAIDELCTLYWLPVYAYVRRRGAEPNAAADTTQAFFTLLLEREDLRSAEPSRGRFRSWLLSCLQHHLTDEHRASLALKRGGDLQFASIDVDDAEARLANEPTDSRTPEWHFERAWAHATLERALDAVGQRHEASGRGERFAQLRDVLMGDDAAPYAELAARLDTTEGSVKVFVHRLRRELGEELHAQIRNELPEDSSAEDVELEVGQLMRALGAA